MVEYLSHDQEMVIRFHPPLPLVCWYQSETHYPVKVELRDRTPYRPPLLRHGVIGLSHAALDRKISVRFGVPLLGSQALKVMLSAFNRRKMGQYHRGPLRDEVLVGAYIVWDDVVPVRLWPSRLRELGVDSDIHNS